jgi:putative tricarboxylic transport membrane protein
MKLIDLMVRVALVACLLGVAPAVAAGYPDKPVTLLVGFRAGGATDTLSRVLAKQLQELLGQPIVVENRGGGGGAVTAELIKSTKPDGYTLGVVITTTVALDPYILKNGINYKQFKYIASIAQARSAIITNPNAPFDSMRELIDYVKAHGGSLAYASQIPMDRVIFQYVGHKAGVTFKPVPTKGGAGVYQLLFGKQVVLAFSGPLFQRYVEAKKIKVIAATGAERASVAPNVPTLREQGYDVVAGTDFIVIAPAGTPAPIVERLAGAIKTAMASADYQKLTKRLLLPPVYVGPEQLTRDIAHAVKTNQQMLAETK